MNHGGQAQWHLAGRWVLASLEGSHSRVLGFAPSTGHNEHYISKTFPYLCTGNSWPSRRNCISRWLSIKSGVKINILSSLNVTCATYITHKLIYKLYTICILHNNKSFTETLKAQSMQLISCQRLATFLHSGALRNRKNKLFKLITSDWSNFLQQNLMICVSLCYFMQLYFPSRHRISNYCCFIMIVLAANQAWYKMAWSYENMENTQIMWKSQVILSGAKCCITLDPFFIAQSSTKIINIWSICVYFNDMYHSKFLVWNR